MSAKRWARRWYERKLQLEELESRTTPSWASLPPATIAPPANAQAAVLNSAADAQGVGIISTNEVDYYTFIAPATGSYKITATTPSSNVDTVLGLYRSNGGRLASNDDISNSNRDSSLTATLTAGSRYYFGITNYIATVGGTYTWTVDGSPTTTPPTTPTTPTNPTTPTTPPTPATSTGGFSITLRMSGLTTSQQAIFNQAAARWAQIIWGDLPNASYRGTAVDDVLIDASAVPIDGVGSILGQAGPDAFRAGSWLPIHGEMEFDSADMARMESNGQLYSVILHEMGHVLGIGTIWQQRGLVTGVGTTNPRYIGPNGAWAYNLLFRTAVNSIPVEGRPSGAGSRDSHWRESILSSELMSPYINGSQNPISTVTVAAMADLGYLINLSMADAMVPSVSAATASAGANGGATSLQAAQSASFLVFDRVIHSLWTNLNDDVVDQLSSLRLARDVAVERR